VELFHEGEWCDCFWWLKDSHSHSRPHRHPHPHSHSRSPRSHCHPHSHSRRHFNSYYFHLHCCLCRPHCCFPVWSQLSMFRRWVSCLHLHRYHRLLQRHQYQYLLLHFWRFPFPPPCHGNSWVCSFVAFFSLFFLGWSHCSTVSSFSSSGFCSHIVFSSIEKSTWYSE
jgi:hypothetical protein